MVINSGFLCLLSGMNHCKSFGGTWRRFVTLRDEIVRDGNLRKCLTIVVLYFIHRIKRNNCGISLLGYGEAKCVYGYPYKRNDMSHTRPPRKMATVK